MTKKGMSELEDFTPSYFKEVYSIEPSQFIDLKALMGDKSDNLPGIDGIGEKTGIKLLKEYGSIENLIASVDKLKGALKVKVETNKDMGLLCKKMTTLVSEYDLPFTLNDLIIAEPNMIELKKFYQKFEFKSLL
jgi:DNA polymerase-1